MSGVIQPEQETAIKLRIEQSFKAEIEEAAKEMHLSVSAFTRLALAEYVRTRKSPNPEPKEAA